MFRTAICLAFLLVGCATGYQTNSGGLFGLGGGGYSETQLSENVWRVHFAGNDDTSEERAGDFTLLRAAELMLQNGYPYFAVAASDSSPEANMSTMAVGYSLSTSVDYEPRTTIVAVGYAAKPEGLAFNAAFVAKSIREKYGITP